MSQNNDTIRPLIKAMIEAHDVLARGSAEIERLQLNSDAPSNKLTIWQKLFGSRKHRGNEIDSQKLSAAATGLRMGQRRVEQLMNDAGLALISAVGQPFDPETMEAVEAIAATDLPPNTVVEELCRGYRWNGRVVRFAQVRVSKR